jgi:outer membrane protein OmpA-like peptidoglycan-associated protein
MRFLILLLLPFHLLSQNRKADSVFCDCQAARTFTINGKMTTNKTIAPPGPGLTDEISPAKLKTRFAFEKEHHSAWYKLVIGASGKLCFDIVPLKADDDYDFMVFKAGSKNFCDSLSVGYMSPLRACISRDKEELKGITGLNHTSKEKLVKQGVGSAYAKALQVKAGDVYFLVLDNVYDNGEGHFIRFEISELVSFKGTLKNEQDKPLRAEVSLSGQNGEVILKTETRADGTYAFTQPIISNNTYALNFYSDSNFTYTKPFTLKDTVELRSLKTILPDLKKGKKYSVGTINFHPNSPNTLPESRTAMRNLYKLMRKNPGLRITIIGHCNGMNGAKHAITDALSKDRAEALKKYLVALGIETGRLETEGKGDSEMLFPYTPMRTASQEVQNRRVEIMVLEY